MTRFILRTTDPSDMPYALSLAQECLAQGTPEGWEYVVFKGNHPTRKALVRVNPKSISVHCERKNSL